MHRPNRPTIKNDNNNNINNNKNSSRSTSQPGPRVRGAPLRLLKPARPQAALGGGVVPSRPRTVLCPSADADDALPRLIVGPFVSPRGPHEFARPCVAPHSPWPYLVDLPALNVVVVIVAVVVVYVVVVRFLKRPSSSWTPSTTHPARFTHLCYLEVEGAPAG